MSRYRWQTTECLVHVLVPCPQEDSVGITAILPWRWVCRECPWKKVSGDDRGGGLQLNYAPNPPRRLPPLFHRLQDFHAHMNFWHPFFVINRQVRAYGTPYAQKKGDSRSENGSLIGEKFTERRKNLARWERCHWKAQSHLKMKWGIIVPYYLCMNNLSAWACGVGTYGEWWEGWRWGLARWWDEWAVDGDLNVVVLCVKKYRLVEEVVIMAMRVPTN